MGIGLTEADRRVVKAIKEIGCVDIQKISEHIGMPEEKVKRIYNNLPDDQKPAEYDTTVRDAEVLLAARQSNEPVAHKRYIAKVVLAYAQPVNGAYDSAVNHAVGGKPDLYEFLEFYKDIPLDRSLCFAQGGEIVFVSPADMDAEGVAIWKRYHLNPVPTWIFRKPHFDILQYLQHPTSLKTEQGHIKLKECGARLEARGLAVVTTDRRGMVGLVLTKAGFELAERIKQDRLEAPIRELKAKHIPQAVRCPRCGGTFLQTNWKFKADEPVLGEMLSAYGVAEDGGWSLPFGHMDSGEAIICVECSGRLTGEDGRLIEGILVNIAKK